MSITRRWLGLIVVAALMCASAAASAESRRQPLAVQTKVTPAQIFSYAERAYPSLFPAGPATQVIENGGKRYTVRYYAATGNYLGVGEDDGVLYGLGTFTGGVLSNLGPVDNYLCEALNLVCITGAVGSNAAWAGAQVEARCKGGTFTSGVGASGFYSAAQGGEVLPCVLRATASDGRQLYSVLPATSNGLGGGVLTNITPVTSLVTAYLAGGNPEAFYAGFSANQAGRLSASAVQGASNAVAATLRTAGIDFAPGGDLLTGALNLGANGTPQGRLLVQLQSKLTGSLTQATLEDAIARTTPEAKAAGTPSLPAELLLAPAAPNCSALRSGKYLFATSDTANPLLMLTLDAPALKLVELNLTLTAAGKCHYKQTGVELAVSDAGVMLGTSLIGTSSRAVIAVPAQTPALSELAGRWNALTTALDPQAAADGYLHSATSTYDSNGRLTELTYCGKEAGKLASDCTTGTGAQIPDIRLSVDPGGGFLITNRSDGGSTSRMAAYRTGSGELMMIVGGRMSFITAARRAEVPDLGRVQEFWALNIASNDTAAAALTETKNTVVAADATAGTFRRDSVINFSTGATRPERFEINRYRDGYSRRIPENVTGTDGSAQSVSEFLSLPMRGAGLTPVAVLGSTQTLSLSLLKSTAP